MILSVIYAMKEGKATPIGKVSSVARYEKVRILMRNKLYIAFPAMNHFVLKQYTVNPVTKEKTLIKH